MKRGGSAAAPPSRDTAAMLKTGTKGLMQVWCQTHQIWYSRGLDDCPECAKFIKCDGMEREGGAFSLGPVTWRECANPATLVMIVIQDGSQTERHYACQACREKGEANGIKIVSVEPLTGEGARP